MGQHSSASASRLLRLDGFEVTAAEVVDDEWRLEAQTTAATVGWCGYASALVAPLGHARVVVDHFHVIKLASTVVDQVRRIQQATLGIGAQARSAVSHPQAAVDRGRAAHQPRMGAAPGRPDRRGSDR